MRIKIIRNNIKFNSSFTSIDKYIGQIFKVESLEENGNANELELCRFYLMSMKL